MADDWAELIGHSVLLRQQLHDTNPQLHPYTIPRLAATTEQLAEAERHLGHDLDPLHRELLAHGNGWEHFRVYAHLLSTDELGTSENWRQGNDLLDIFYQDGVVAEDFPRRDDIYLIVANPAEVEDLFVIWRAGPVSPAGGRPVLWLAGEEVERYPDTREFLLSTNQYLKNKLASTQT
ncbi:SMI1/KNR4 family protein [Amycolatopsis aidingensis]|uniref:SMI1/KNR4 family protein n=1 Tax=Amycolatopsis aidingensis TaxID=2842453 RepID=UPI001C0D797A|nr:SMI1/KNR4 family protein [Amycolatopsis aidingensis]